MAEGKKSFIFYSDWIDTFKELPKDKGYDLLMHILSYVNDENPETEDFVISAIFAQMKNTLKRDLKKWEDQRIQRSKAGKRSAEVRKAKINERSTVVNEKERKSTVSVSDSVSVSVNDKNNIPTFEDFKEHAMLKCQSANLKYDESKLRLKYDSWLENGWKTGKDKKIKNWKSTLTNTISFMFDVKISSTKPPKLAGT
jgi:hypothetical protein